MLVTGETFRFRSVLFIVIALGMIIFFSTTVLSTRGSIAVSEDTFFSGETPFCHLVIPMIIVPALMTGTVIFPGSMLEGFAPIALMLVLWTAASLVGGSRLVQLGLLLRRLRRSLLAPGPDGAHQEHRPALDPDAVGRAAGCRADQRHRPGAHLLRAGSARSRP